MTVLLTVAVLTLASLSFVVAGTMSDAGPLGLIDSGTDDSDTNQNQDSGVTMLDWADHELDLNVVAPVATNFSSTAFVAEPDEDGDFGNYVDYNASDAQSGLSAGVDYFKEEVTNSKTISYPANLRLPAGETLSFGIVDTTGTEYHDTFVDGEVPTEVSQIDYEKSGSSVSIVGSDAFTRLADYSSDSASIESVNGETADFESYGTSATDLADSAYDAETDQTVEVVRTIELNHGAMALGELNKTNVSSNVKSADVQVTYEDENGNTVSLFDETVADADGFTDFKEEFKEEMETNPAFVNSDLTVTMDVEFDGSSVTSDEELLSIGVLDIYGNAVGTQDSVSLTA